MSDFLYAFLNKFEGNIGFVVQGLFLIQLFVLLCSYWGSLNKLRKDLGVDRKKWPYIHHIKRKTGELFGEGSIGSCFGHFIVYPIAAVLYYALVFVISLMLALTKLIIIKQVHRWWLSWMVVDYNEELQKQKQKGLSGASPVDSITLEQAASTDSYNRDTGTLMAVDKHKQKQTDVAVSVEWDEIKSRVVGKDNKWLGYEVDDSLYFKIILAIDRLTPYWMLKLKINANLYNTLFLTGMFVIILVSFVLFVVS